MGYSEPKVLVAPEFGQAFAFVKDAAAVCDRSVSSRKLCLRQKGSGVCNHTVVEGVDVLCVVDNTLYVRAATTKSLLLTTVYQDLSLHTIGLDTDLVAFLIKFEGAEGPFTPQLLFLFITRNDIMSLSTFEEAMRSQKEGDSLPLLTPSRRKAQSLLVENLSESDLNEFISLMTIENRAVETLMETVEDTGVLRGESATCKNSEWSDEFMSLWKMLLERVDKLSLGSVFIGATAVELMDEFDRRELRANLSFFANKIG